MTEQVDQLRKRIGEVALDCIDQVDEEYIATVKAFTVSARAFMLILRGRGMDHRERAGSLAGLIGAVIAEDCE